MKGIKLKNVIATKLKNVIVPKSCKLAHKFVMVHLGDNCIQNFHSGWYIVGYTVGNLVFGFV